MVGFPSLSISAGLTLCFLSVESAQGDGWIVSFDAAKMTAEESGTPLLIHFYSPYCGPCRQMERQVFTLPAVQRALGDGLASVKIDIQDHPGLKHEFGADIVPRDVVVYPDSSVQTVSVGFVPAASYLSILRDAAARGRSIALMRMEPESDSEVAIDDPAVETQVREEISERVTGLSGFCPVMLTDRRRWVRGSVKLTARHRGILYRFSGVQQRGEFLKDPARYAPRNLGCDPVTLLKEQRAVAGSIRYGAFFDGKLYLFRTDTTRREFKSNPLKYTRIQHAVRPEQLFGQTFR